MDQFDEATAREEKYREAALKNALTVTTKMQPTGHCHWCDEATPPEALFCDADCRDQFDRQLKRQRIAGRPVESNDE